MSLLSKQKLIALGQIVGQRELLKNVYFPSLLLQNSIHSQSTKSSSILLDSMDIFQVLFPSEKCRYILANKFDVYIKKYLEPDVFSNMKTILLSMSLKFLQLWYFQLLSLRLNLHI